MIIRKSFGFDEHTITRNMPVRGRGLKFSDKKTKRVYMK